jgi:hypothetical protein
VKHGNKDLRLKSFCGQGLNKPWTMVEVNIGDNVKKFLIGDINECCGVCDDCTAFNHDAIVLRYAILENLDE